MTYDEALALMARGRFEPLYVATGPSAFWKARWIRELTQRYLGEHRETAFVRVEEASSFQSVGLELATPAFFTPRKVVLVERAKWPKKEETLARYLEHPSPDAVLILDEEKVSPSLEKVVGRQRIVEFQGLSRVAFCRFVEKEARQRGLTFEPDALELFCQWVAGFEEQVLLELDKLSLGPKPTITVDVVRASVVPMPQAEERLWDVTDAVVAKDERAALAALVRHLDHKVAPLMLFIMMARQVVQIREAQKAQQAGQSLEAFQREAGLKDFVAKKLWGAAKRWAPEELELLLTWAYKIDVWMKLGYGEPELWLWFWTLLWPGKKSRQPAGERSV
ncbi:MAG: DNA polymerase III subunit delta [Firmicutes bacterium]|nr:DNA polymerase III subunit delta [Bacillota bacterium]